MARQPTPNCEEFYIKPHPQPEKLLCTSTVFHIISEMISRVYGRASYKISINKLNKIFKYNLGVDPRSIKSNFNTGYSGGLEIRDIQTTLLENPIFKVRDYISNCITYPIINIDLVEVYTLIKSKGLEWNVSLKYANISSTSYRVDNHAVILIKYDERNNIAYLYDPMDTSISGDIQISKDYGLQHLQKISVDDLLQIWVYNPYSNINKYPEELRKKLIVRWTWLLVPKKVSVKRKKEKPSKQTKLVDW